MKTLALVAAAAAVAFGLSTTPVKANSFYFGYSSSSYKHSSPYYGHKSHKKHAYGHKKHRYGYKRYGYGYGKPYFGRFYSPFGYNPYYRHKKRH